MTTNYHTPIADGAPRNAAIVNSPLAELDVAIGDVELTVHSGFGEAVELTIAAGVVTATQTYHSIDTQGDAGSDELDTINGGDEGDLLIIRAEHTDRTVVVKHNTGNIFINSEADISLDDATDHLMLIYDGSKWNNLNL